MNLQLFAHPFSSYSQKVLIALYENSTAFEYRMLSPEHPDNLAEFGERWPLARFPLLVDGDRQVEETSIIIEYLQRRHPGPAVLLPSDPGAALAIRRMDRLFDLYVSTPMQKIVLDALRPEPDRDAFGVERARQRLDIAYARLDAELAGRRWACGDDFTMADCAAAPALFYADWVRPIDGALVHLRGYRARLLARPSVARAVDEARPYRGLFPPGAPDRD